MRSGPYVITLGRPLDKREEYFLPVCELDIGLIPFHRMFKHRVSSGP